MIYSDALDMLPTERVPVFLRDFTLGADVLGIDVADIFGNSFDPELSASSICAFQRFTGQDAVIGCVHSPAFIVEQFGGEMRYPKGKIPVTVRRPLSGMTDFGRLDMSFKGRIANALESYAVVKKRMEGIAEVVGNVTGPVTKAGVLAGTEEITMMMESDPDVLRDLLEFCTEFGDVITERLSENVDSFIIAAAVDNPDLFGFDRYEEFSVPYTKRMCSKMRKCGKRIVYHPHGVFVSGEKDNSDSILDMDIDCYHFAENSDPYLVSERFKGKMCVMGGTDIVPTLYSGEEDAIRSETERYLDAFDGGYVFAASCSLHTGVPLENIRTMVDTVRGYQ